jgi:tetratricopeptide (TPR) repeat protein
MYAAEIDNDSDLMEQLLLELTSKYPKEKRAWCELGEYYQFAHRFEQAVDAFGKVLSLDPVHDDALNGMAYTYAARADYERAADYFRRNAAAHPENANPHDSLAEMYFKMGKMDEAIDAFERALAIKPDFGSQRGVAYVKVLQEDWKGAIVQIERLIDAVQSEGLKASYRLILGFFHDKSFRWRLALDLAQKSALVFESVGNQFALSGAKWNEANIYYALGDIRLSRESLVEAQAAMRASGNNPAWAPLYSDILMGLLELKENRVEEAKKRFTSIDSLLSELAEKEPQFKEMGAWSAAVYRVEVLLTDGRIDEAISAAGALPPVTIPNLNPLTMYLYNWPYERDVLARAYVQKGEVDDAIAEYEWLVTFDPDRNDRRMINPLFHYRLGVLYEGRGDTDRAIQQYDKFLKICGEADPRLEEIADTRRRLAALGR